MRKHLLHSLFLLSSVLIGCTPSSSVDITPHTVHPQADILYQKALELSSYYDVDSTKKTLAILDSALEIDSFNPDYYGLKAKLISELGLLDSALTILEYADSKGAVNGEYLFQKGLLYAAKDKNKQAKQTFKRSKDNLEAVLEQYPDSLGAFILQQAAKALYFEQDSLYMPNTTEVRKRFPDRLMEVEMTRRLKPSSLIKQLKEIEEDYLFPSDTEMQQLIEEALEEQGIDI